MSSGCEVVTDGYLEVLSSIDRRVDFEIKREP
jgi:hypothetical protein